MSSIWLANLKFPIAGRCSDEHWTLQNYIPPPEFALLVNGTRQNSHQYPLFSPSDLLPSPWFSLCNSSRIHPYLSILTALVWAFDHLIEILLRASSVASRFPRPCSFRTQASLRRRWCPPPSQTLTLASHFPSKALPTPVHAHCGLASFSCPCTSSDCTSHKVSNMHANSHLITFDLTSPSLGILFMLPWLNIIYFPP